MAHENSRLGVRSELQLPACATTTETPDVSHICDLHCCVGLCRILNPLSKARDQTRILTETMSSSQPAEQDEQDEQEQEHFLLNRNSFFFNYFFGCTRGIEKFPGQGLNLCHSCHNTGSLTCYTTRELPSSMVFIQ